MNLLKLKLKHLSSDVTCPQEGVTECHPPCNNPDFFQLRIYSLIMLSTDTWSTIFSFLTIEDVERTTEVIVESRPAFEVSIFTVAELRPWFRMHVLTSKAQAIAKFNEVAAKGSECQLTDWRMKRLDYANGEK